MRNTMLLAMVMMMTACGLNASPGDGEKIGQIVKLSKVGLTCKTWEGEIVRGGFTNTSGVNGTAFDFTVESDSLAKVVRDAMEAQQEMKIAYRSEGVWSACRSDTGHFLVSAQPIGAPK